MELFCLSGDTTIVVSDPLGSSGVMSGIDRNLWRVLGGFFDSTPTQCIITW